MHKTRALSYYLPQFHNVTENNEWWGEGFTEWTNLRKAKKQFDGHEIILPLDDRYYNLLEKKVVEWQTKLMNQYNIYGLVYYHYWFKGRTILEKPVENLLQWNDIDQRFMFMWANHDWTRSWTGGDEVLIKQEYGEKQDWINHIHYLLTYFQDSRYIKINNKPVIQIYKPHAISVYKDMLDVWKKECKKFGYSDLYVINNINNINEINEVNNKYCDEICIQEHTCSLDYWRRKSFIDLVFNKIQHSVGLNNRIRSYSYESLAYHAIKLLNNLPKNKNYTLTVPTSWDNTPRYGSSGYILSGSTPTNFSKWLMRAKEISDANKYHFIIIACWNEWCEGMCLEPSKQFGHAYLESVQTVFTDTT